MWSVSASHPRCGSVEIAGNREGHPIPVSMTRRNIGAARRLRASREEWQARIDAAERTGSCRP
jgi:hypothetical protein